MSFAENKHHKVNEYFSKLEVDDEDGSDFTDHWNSGELLCLASAVQRSGDKNWVSVSRSVKPLGEPKRPSDWYASKNCALQYSKLLKGVEDLKKKSLPRTERETSEELLLKNLTDKRLTELNWLNRQMHNTGIILKTQLEMLENGDFDDHLDEMLRQVEEHDKGDEEEYKEWLSRRESLNLVKRLNKCRAPISKGKAPTSRSLEARRKNSPNPDHSDHDISHSLIAESAIKVEIDTDDSPQLTPTKMRIKTEQDLLTKLNDDIRMSAPQISIPTSHPAPPTSPLLTSLLRNVASATPTNPSAVGNSNSSPVKEITTEDLLLSAKLLSNSPEAINFRKSDASQQIFLSPTQTSTSSISPLLTSLLKSPTAATPVSPISTNVTTPSLPKEMDKCEALDTLKLLENALETGNIVTVTQGYASSHPMPATSPLLNSLLKSPTSSAPAVTSISSLQIAQPKEATTPKSISPPQPFFNPTSALATAAAQQLAVATANLPQNHHFFQQPESLEGHKSSVHSSMNSATLSAPTLSKLLEMPPSTPGKLPPLPVIDSPSCTTSSVLTAADPIQSVSSMQASGIMQTPPRNTNIIVQKALITTSPKGDNVFQKVEQIVKEIKIAEAASTASSDMSSFTGDTSKPLENFPFDDVDFETAESVLKAISTGRDVDSELERSRRASLNLSPSMSLANKFEKISSPVTEFSGKTPEIMEDDNGTNSKKFYKSRVVPKKRASADEDPVEKEAESIISVSPKLPSKKIGRPSKETFEFNSDNEQPLTAEFTLPQPSDLEENKEDKDSEKSEAQSPVHLLKKPRIYEKQQPKDIKKELSDDEAFSLRRPGRRAKKFRGKVSKVTSSKMDDPKDQYEFSESTEENSVGYQTTNTLCYMPRMREEAHLEEAKIKLSPSQVIEIEANLSHTPQKLASKPLEKRYFNTSHKIKQESPSDVPAKKSLFVSDEEQLSDSFDMPDDVSNTAKLAEDKVKNWRAISEKQVEAAKSTSTAAKMNIQKAGTVETPKSKPETFKKTFSRSAKNEIGKRGKKRHLKDATDSDFDELAAFSQDSEEATFPSISEQPWQRQGDNETSNSLIDRIKREPLDAEMEAETNDSHVSSSIAAESDKQIDDMEGYESLQGSITTDFSTPPLSAKDDKERSRFSKQEWYHGSSPKSSEPVSQSSEESEDYESDNSDNQSVSTNKSTSHSTDAPRMKRKERESQQYKAWRKSISIVWREASCHKYANVFLQKVTNDVAPGYLSIVNRPMDLSLIKRNIDNGVIRTTNQFQRDMMLMFQNAIMYNSSDHDVYHMAVEMQRDVNKQIEDYLATQIIIEEKTGEPATSTLRAARNAKIVSKTPQSLQIKREDPD